MSDYLSNLITRSLGATAVIQPRLPSLFEPAVPYLGALSESLPELREIRRDAPMDVEEPDEETGSPEPRAAVRSSRPPAAPRRNGPPAREKPDAIKIARIPEPLVSDFVEVSVGPEVSSSHANASSSVEPRDENAPPRPEAHPPHHPGETPREPDQPSRPKIINDSSSIAPELSREENSSRPSVTHPPMAAVNPRRTKTLAPRDWSDLLEAKIESARNDIGTEELREQAEAVQPARLPMRDSRLPRVPAIEPPRARPFEFARYVPPLPLARSPEPTVQVTIGRIEVRAVSEKAGKPKERQVSPVMSLNDYLRSKRGSA